MKPDKALQLIAGMAGECVESNGARYLSDHEVLRIARKGLSSAGGTAVQRAALSEISEMAELATVTEASFPEADVLALAESALA